MKINNYLVFALISLLLSLFTTCKQQDVHPEIEPAIKIEPSSLSIPKNEIAGYRLTVQASNVSLKSTEVKWTSNNTRVATVNDAGFVTGLGAGEAEIIATLVNGKGFATCKVTVYDENDYKFRLILKDKGTSPFSIDRPEEFLSIKAIARRRKRNINVDEKDLPISPEYIKEIEKIGGVVVAQSKWLKTVSVHCSDEFLMDKYKELPFVEDVVVVWQGKRNPGEIKNLPNASSDNIKSSSEYGAAWDNINLNKGQVLHELGFKGAGMDIAVIDAGFSGLQTNTSFSNINIKGAKSFIYGNNNTFDTNSHGIWVLSCMATNKPGFYVGTAPEANYWLLHTEDESSEYPIEEDYWVTAIEYADSAGVDIVNTSLYYTGYDLPSYKLKWEDINGKTAMASRAANVAAAKGIFIVGCAGNSQSWIGTPGDSPHVLTVGSVNKSGSIGEFTAYGITVDGRIKPDVVALGAGAYVINVNGSVDLKSGTSYASPIMCGLAACLWQAYPNLSNHDLLDIIKQSADRYSKPELPYGYGVSNMQKALELAQNR